MFDSNLKNPVISFHPVLIMVISSLYLVYFCNYIHKSDFYFSASFFFFFSQAFSKLADLLELCTGEVEVDSVESTEEALRLLLDNFDNSSKSSISAGDVS